MTRLLEVKDLAISFKTYGGEVQAIRGVNFHLDKGETLAIVGESGSGKSVTSQAIMKLIPILLRVISNAVRSCLKERIWCRCLKKKCKMSGEKRSA